MNRYNGAPYRRNEEWRLGYSPARIAGTFAAQPPLMRQEADGLREQGVPADSLKHVRSACIVRIGRGFEFHQFANQGRPERAFLLLVADIRVGPIDLAAWQPTTGWLGTWLDVAWALGQESVCKPRLTEHGALSVHQTPLEWLRGGCRGIVLIRPRLAAEFLSDAGPLLAESIEHGTDLEVALTRKPPRILVAVPGGGQ